MPNYNPYFPVTYQPVYQPNYSYQQPIQQPQMQTAQVQPQAQNPAQNQGGVNWVQGEAGAKSWPVPPNSSVMLMDSEGDRFYLKTVDASGMPLPLRVFEYHELGQERKQAPLMENDSPYATKAEFEAFRSEIRGMIETPSKGRREAVADE